MVHPPSSSLPLSREKTRFFLPHRLANRPRMRAGIQQGCRFHAIGNDCMGARFFFMFARHDDVRRPYRHTPGRAPAPDGSALAQAPRGGRPGKESLYTRMREECEAGDCAVASLPAPGAGEFVIIRSCRDGVGLTMDSSQPDADLYHLKIDIGMLPMYRKCLGILPTSMLAKALSRTSYVRTRHRTTAARVLPSRLG